MKIVETTTRTLKNGTKKGTIKVVDGKRKYSVKFEVEPNGHAEQWGAATEVLCFTYKTFENLCFR